MSFVDGAVLQFTQLGKKGFLAVSFQSMARFQAVLRARQYVFTVFGLTSLRAFTRHSSSDDRSIKTKAPAVLGRGLFVPT